MSDEKRIKELENSLSIALDINEKYQIEIKKLMGQADELKAKLAREKEDHQYDNLVHANELRKMSKR